MLKVTLLMTALICQELGNVSPDISDNELYYSQISERMPQKKSHYPLKEQFSRSNTPVKTVAVTCYPTYMVIMVKVDLFSIGIPINASDLRLGTKKQHGTACGVIATSTDEYILEAALTDCGTQHWVTEDALIYTNFLIYSPEYSLDLVRTEDAVIPVKCHYARSFTVDVDPILPTWIPHHTMRLAAEHLDFSLKLMTSDWHKTRPSSMYFLGNEINLEASVYMPQMVLLVFIESCIVTTTPNMNSVPRYKLVDKGCVVDGQLTGSKSRFLPRTQPNKLQLQLEAFLFHQMSCEIYVTCTLKAYPLNHVSGSMSKACSFIDGSWRSAEGDDWTCTSCGVDQAPLAQQSQLNPTNLLHSSDKWAVLTSGMQADSARPSPIMTGSMFSRTLKEPAAAWSSAVFQKQTKPRTWEKEATIGPLTVLAWKNNVGVPREKEGSPHFSSVGDKKQMQYDHLWENEVLASIEADEGTTTSEATDSPVAMTASKSLLWGTGTSAAEALHTLIATSSEDSDTGASLLVANPAIEKELPIGTVPSIYGSDS